MKKLMTCAALFSLLILAACSKEDVTGNNNNNQPAVVKYEFTATKAGNYNLETVTDSAIFVGTVYTDNWTNSANSKTEFSSHSAKFTVFPPNDWANTNNTADVSLKIFVNGVLRASTTDRFVGVDRPTGVTISASF